MIITEKALEQLKSLVIPDAGINDGIRIGGGSGCCGPAFEMALVPNPLEGDLKEVHEGINFYLDSQFAGFNEILTIDFSENYFEIKGINDFPKSGCCEH